MRRMSGPAFEIACLCAAWCRLCDDYAPVLRQGMAELQAAGVPLRWHWIDIEDEADLLGDFDIETFPTLVIADGQTVRFAGPLTPQPETLRRVLRATVLDAREGAAWPVEAVPVQEFVLRLRARPDDASDN
jgi:thioredoxin 1